MLQNLPVHFDNPEFRADALRGVAKTLRHINHLISRLSSLRHDLQIKPVESDLNEVVAKALAGWERSRRHHPGQEFAAVPETASGPGANLQSGRPIWCSTPRKPSPKAGQVHVETSQNNGWAVLTVSDNGCGMSRNF